MTKRTLCVVCGDECSQVVGRMDRENNEQPLPPFPGFSCMSSVYCHRLCRAHLDARCPPPQSREERMEEALRALLIEPGIGVHGFACENHTLCVVCDRRRTIEEALA